MLKYIITRMGNGHKVWKRCIRNKKALLDVLDDEDYIEWEAARKTSEEKEKCAAVREILEDRHFWSELVWLVKATRPAYKLLRMVDGFRPTAGKFYYKALRVQVTMHCCQ